jgi:hypothetical protein
MQDAYWSDQGLYLFIVSYIIIIIIIIVLVLVISIINVPLHPKQAETLQIQ